jgi:hypothetical protein
MEFFCFIHFDGVGGSPIGLLLGIGLRRMALAAFSGHHPLAAEAGLDFACWASFLFHFLILVTTRLIKFLLNELQILHCIHPISGGASVCTGDKRVHFLRIFVTVST